MDVRVIAATNRDLKEEVSRNRFREDLYYRLNVVQITVPPLRERTDDLPLLTTHFIEKHGHEAHGKTGLKISPAALRRLYSYPWPGNVRELENAIERAVILCSSDTIEPEDLPEELQLPAEGRSAQREDLAQIADGLLPGDMDLSESMEAIEKALIVKALAQADGVQAHAARLLGIKKNVMQYKMKKYGLL